MIMYNTSFSTELKKDVRNYNFLSEDEVNKLADIYVNTHTTVAEQMHVKEVLLTDMYYTIVKICLKNLNGYKDEDIEDIISKIYGNAVYTLNHYNPEKCGSFYKFFLGSLYKSVNKTGFDSTHRSAGSANDSASALVYKYKNKFTKEFGWEPQQNNQLAEYIMSECDLNDIHKLIFLGNNGVKNLGGKKNCDFYRQTEDRLKKSYNVDIDLMDKYLSLQKSALVNALNEIDRINNFRSTPMSLDAEQNNSSDTDTYTKLDVIPDEKTVKDSMFEDEIDNILYGGDEEESIRLQEEFCKSLKDNIIYNDDSENKDRYEIFAKYFGIDPELSNRPMSFDEINITLNFRYKRDTALLKRLDDCFTGKHCNNKNRKNKKNMFKA